MKSEVQMEPEFESMKALLLDMAQEVKWESLIALIGDRLLQRPHLSMVRIWLVKQGDRCESCPMKGECPGELPCLHLESCNEKIQGARKRIDDVKDTYSRIPLGKTKIGQIAETKKPFVVSNIVTESKKEANRKWASEKNICGMAGFPIVFKNKLLGVVAVFPDNPMPAGGYPEGQIWGQILSDHIAAAFANAEAFDEVESLSRFASENPNPVFRVGRDGKIIYANDSAEYLFSAWKSGPCSSLPEEFCDPIRDVLDSGAQKELEIANRGSIFTFDMVPILEMNYINVYGRDITAAREAEKKLRIVMAEKEKMEGELRLAGRVQKDFLPTCLPQNPHYRFSARMTPAKFVGGDFFDFIDLGENRLGIAFGDLAGKGVSAALSMARLMSDFRYVARDCDPGGVLRAVNEIMIERPGQTTFATAVFLCLDMAQGTVKISNAGHLPIILNRRNGSVERYDAGQIPVGILPGLLFPVQEISLEPGDFIFLYTDGAVEIEDSQHCQFGLERLIQLAKENRSEPEIFLDRVESTLQGYSQNAPLRDDQTLLAFERISFS